MRVLLDYRPLRVFGSFGAIFLAIGVGFEVFLIGHYIFSGSFSPYKSSRFIGLGFIIFGLFVFLIALISDILNCLRLNQDKILYEIKKSEYGKQRSKR